MFLGRQKKQSEVAKVLHKNGIVKDSNVVRTYANDLEKKGYLTKGKPLPLPGPPKLSKVKTLTPIFNTMSYYRSWKMFPQDERQLLREERKKLTKFFKTVSPFLDYFPQHLSRLIKVGGKGIRGLTWNETLSVFLDFCVRVTEACWSINKLPLINGELPFPKEAFASMPLPNPYEYVQDGYRQNKITATDISNLAKFSINGPNDIYMDTFLREVYLMSISIKNPIEVLIHLQNVETVMETLFQNKLRDLGIGVRALFHAILKRSQEEGDKMIIELQKIANHRVRDRLWKEKSREGDVDKTLENIIKKLNLTMTKEELMEALVNLEVCELLERRIEKLKKRTASFPPSLSV